MYSLAIAICGLLAFNSALAIEVHGHRGSRGTHPENTLPALKEALASGADTLEFDLAMSKDGVLFLAHDRKINIKICQNWDGTPLEKEIPLFHLSFKEIQNLDCGSIQNPDFPKQKASTKTKMPSFEEVLIWLNKADPKRTVQMNIETKVEKPEEGLTATPKAFATEIAKLLQKHNAVERSIIQGFDFRSLAEIRKILPKIRISLLVWEQDWKTIETAISKYRPNYVSPNPFWLNPEKIMALRKHELKPKLVVWTINDKSAWQKLIAAGVDGIITDYPRDLVEFLRKK